jgi:hypothetical protein
MKGVIGVLGTLRHLQVVDIEIMNFVKHSLILQPLCNLCIFSIFFINW